jgi:hypothetical protein
MRNWVPSSGSSFNLVTEVFAEQHIVDARQFEMMKNQRVIYRS